MAKQFISRMTYGMVYHNMFFWLLLKDGLNTLGLLKRKNMVLEFGPIIQVS